MALIKLSVCISQLCFKHKRGGHGHGGAADGDALPPFNPAQCGTWPMNMIPVDPALLEIANWVGVDPGKVNMITFSTGEKLPATECYAVLRHGVASTP
jgi:hypothetical protein